MFPLITATSHSWMEEIKWERVTRTYFFFILYLVRGMVTRKESKLILLQKLLFACHHSVSVVSGIATLHSVSKPIGPYAGFLICFVRSKWLVRYVWQCMLCSVLATGPLKVTVDKQRTGLIAQEATELF